MIGSIIVRDAVEDFSTQSRVFLIIHAEMFYILEVFSRVLYNAGFVDVLGALNLV